MASVFCRSLFYVMEKVKLFFKAMFSLSRQKTPVVYRYAALLFLDVAAMLWFMLCSLPTGNPHFIVCIVKNLTGYPCPACGTTRGLKYFFHFMPVDAFMMNPLSVLTGTAMIVLLFWSVRDLVIQKPTLFNFLQIKIKWYFVVLIIVGLICNEIWNIQKGL